MKDIWNEKVLKENVNLKMNFYSSEENFERNKENGLSAEIEATAVDGVGMAVEYSSLMTKSKKFPQDWPSQTFTTTYQVYQIRSTHLYTSTCPSTVTGAMLSETANGHKKEFYLFLFSLFK